MAASNGKAGFGTITFDKLPAEAISSLAFGVKNSADANTGGGGGAGKATFENVTFTKPLSQLSKTLFQGCLNGVHIKQVSFDLLDSKGTRIAQIILTDVLISSYVVAPTDTPLTSGIIAPTDITGIIAPTDSPLPLERVSLSAANIEYILIGL